MNTEEKIKVLEEKNKELQGVLEEVMSWIDNWGASFEDDDEWEATMERVSKSLESK